LTIRGIIFDLGWTLMDFTGDVSAVEKERARDVSNFLHDQGFSVPDADVFGSYREEMMALWQLAESMHYEYPASLAMLRALRRHVGWEDAAWLTRGALNASYDSMMPHWQLYPDAIDTLSALRDAGYRLGCISNTNDGTMVWRMVEQGGLRQWLSPIYTSEELGLRKPHPYPFRLVLDGWGMDSTEVVMVGDTLNADVLGAHNAEMRGIWIRRELGSPWSNNEEAQDNIKPDARIEQLAELPELLNSDWGDR
jgi:HAD superfamily hydrolase (TIGR01549 family)